MALTRPEYEALRGGATLVTANAYLAEVVRHEYSQCAAPTARAWRSPDILPFSAWIERWFNATTLDPAGRLSADAIPTLLTREQERALWSRVIRNSPAARDATHVTSLIDEAQSTWHLLHESRIPLRALRAHGGHMEAIAFANWIDAFDRLCRDSGWLDRARLPAWLADHAEPATTALLTRGFVPQRPAYAATFAICHRHFAHIGASTSAKLPADIRQQPAADSMAEFHAAAHWALALLAREPNARLAIVVADRQAEVAAGLHVLQQELAPQQIRSETPFAAPPFYTTWPRPVRADSMITGALNLLSLRADDNAIEFISALLTDPWIGIGAASARAHLDAKLRRVPMVSVSLARLAREAHRLPDLQAFADALDAHRLELASGVARRRLLDWAGDFGRTLARWRWLADIEPAARDERRFAWDDAIDALIGLDLVLPPCRRVDALALLRDLLRRRRLPAAPITSPIHVVELDAAAELRADHVWVTGLHQQAWPPPNYSHPLLAATLQRRYQLPPFAGATRLRETQATLDSIIDGAQSAVFSWPMRSGHTNLRPATMLRAYPTPVRAYDRQLPTDWRVVAAAAHCESISDTRADAIPAATELRGGAALLNDQAACPFRAFARHRLGAEPLADLEPGLNAAARGQLVHAVLHELWRRLRSWQALTDLSAADRGQVVADSIGTAFAACRRVWRVALGVRFQTLERQRLELLLDDWLRCELARAPFTIEALEQQLKLSIGGIGLRVRLDRVDRLASGRRLIIDYKTGKVAIRDWLGDRPEACQLPLYAVSATEVGGIAFARVARRDAGYLGITEIGTEGPGLTAATSAWSEQLANWRAVLITLAQEFGNGHAAVTPAPYACRYCTLAELCRIENPGS